MKKLTYFKKGSMEPIDKEFNVFEEMVQYVADELLENTKTDRVYLITHNSLNDKEDFSKNCEIFIHHNPIKALKYFSYCDFSIQYHLHEYQSYEDAYAVAKDMKEVHPLCYNNHKLN